MHINGNVISTIRFHLMETGILHSSKYVNTYQYVFPVFYGLSEDFFQHFAIIDDFFSRTPTKRNLEILKKDSKPRFITQ